MNFSALYKRSAFSVQRLVITIFLFSIFYILYSAAPAYASSQITPSPTIQNTNASTNPDVPNNLHNWTQTVMIEVMSSLTCQLAGVDPTNPNQACLGVDQKTGKIGFVDPSAGSGGGAIGVMGNMISTLYTPPLRSVDYFQNLAQDFGITKKTYAQTAGLPAEASAKAGTGFQGLTPLLGIWTVFRNIVYLLLVMVFVVIGLAIMLRVKIDPRTVMTIQNQIPKIIIGILAVTFSFAIAGFLIDLMYVFIYLVIGIFMSIPDTNTQQIAEATQHLQGDNAIGAFNNFVGFQEVVTNSAGGVKDVVQDLLGTNVVSDVIDGNRDRGILALVWDGVRDTLGAVLGLVAGIVALLVIAIAVLVALFRLWISLIMAYVYILVDVALAPFFIIAGVVPGSSINFSAWLRDIGANLLAFPVTIFMFLLGKVFIDNFGADDKTAQFIPPLIGNPSNTGTIGALIGLGIILMTPNVVNMLKAALKAPKIDTGIGKAIGAGVGAPSSILHQGGSIGLSLSGLSSIPGVNNLPFINKIRGGAKHT